MSHNFRPYLPGVLSYIAEEISLDLAVRLAEAKGGREVYISNKAGSSLAELLGAEDALRLYKLLGGGKLVVPAGNFGGQAGRRQRIAMLLGQGKSHSVVAAEVDVTLRTVERVAASLRRRNDDQGDFFI
ncbi:hypothetical protein [Phaeobacter sp. JH204B]|uniref:hypothetical protein n=1 Tax=Phaeobacter sp. JH204B TaxID=3112503 RepID=UPI003A868AD8